MNLSIHKTLEKSDDKRQVVLRVSDGKTVTKIVGDQIDIWIKDLNSDMTIRATSVHAQDPILNAIIEKGNEIVYANWHKTGIEKNLGPDEIVQQFAVLPESTFRKFIPRPDLTELRYRVNQRLAIMEYRKAAILKIHSNAILFGHVDEENLPEEIKQLMEEAEKIEINVPVMVKGKERKLSIDTVIANLAKKIPECQLFNSSAHIETSWNTAAAVIAFSGGIDRFDNVASFWHYCGQDPTSNKRKKGQSLSFNPKIKTILWQMSDSIVKNRNNPWRDFYDRELDKEVTEHKTKHPDCKTPKGHCMAMAKVKMRKEILKRFFLAVKGEEYR